MADECIERAFLASEQGMASALGGERHLPADAELTSQRIQLHSASDRISGDLKPPAAAKARHTICEALFGHLDLLFDASILSVHLRA